MFHNMDTVVVSDNPSLKVFEVYFLSVKRIRLSGFLFKVFRQLDA